MTTDLMKRELNAEMEAKGFGKGRILKVGDEGVHTVLTMASKPTDQEAAWLEGRFADGVDLDSNKVYVRTPAQGRKDSKTAEEIMRKKEAEFNYKNQIVLEKGESIKFLDYTIKNSLNNDGLVLMKEKGKPYEGHLGNYGTGTQENIDSCMRYAIAHFMVARPEEFASTVVHKMMRLNSGTMHEYYKFRNACKKDGIELPKEVTCGDPLNAMVWFKDKPLAKEKTED